MKWPKELEAFVKTAFQRAESFNPLQKHTLNEQLQTLLKMAAETKMVNGTDWKNQKIPVLDGGPLQLARKKKDRKHSGPDFESLVRKRARSERFKSKSPTQLSVHVPETTGIIHGTCKDLEKNYLRLTLAPNPAVVRPQEVLERLLVFIMEKYKQTKQYSYVINQFKLIRQDLTVQHIKNGFTVRVYEENARISMDNGDLGEFNQCQTQLKVLYHQQRQGKTFICGEAEFVAYRILYMIMTSNQPQLAKLELEVLTKYSQFDKNELLSLARKLLVIASEITLGRYTEIFRLLKDFYTCADRYGVTLLGKAARDHLEPKNQLRALATITSAYRQVPMGLINDQIGVTGEFLASYGLEGFINNGGLDCVSARQKLHDMVTSVLFSKIDIKGQK